MGGSGGKGESACASLAKPGKDRTAANSAAAAGSITVTATTSVTPKCTVECDVAEGHGHIRDCAARTTCGEGDSAGVRGVVGESASAALAKATEDRSSAGTALTTTAAAKTTTIIGTTAATVTGICAGQGDIDRVALTDGFAGNIPAVTAIRICC